MADNFIKDSLGRIVGDTSNLPLIKGLLESTKMGSLKNYGGPKRPEVLEEIKNILKELNTNFESFENNAKKYVDDIIKAYKEGCDKKPKEKDCCDKLSDSLGAVAELANKGILHDINKNITVMSKAIRTGNIPGGDPAIEASVSAAVDESSATKAGVEMADHIQKAMNKKLNGQRMFNILGTFQAATRQFLGGADITQHLFGGLVGGDDGGDISHMREMSRLAYYVEGATKSSVTLQNEWAKTNNYVAETGFHTSVFNSQLSKIMSRGIKSLKLGRQITKTGLHAATALGANADQTMDVFFSWNEQLGMSTHMMDDMSRRMQRIGRETGITGDNLMEVARASDSVLKKLRDYSKLTSTSAESVLSMMAQAKKLGVDDQVGKMLSALTSKNEFLFRADPQTKMLLVQLSSFMSGGANKNLLTPGAPGILDSRESRKDFAKSFEKFANKYGASLSDDFLQDPANLAQIERINLMLEPLGVTLEQLRRMQDAAMVGTDSYADALAKLVKEQNTGILTAEEMAAIEKKKNKLTIDTGASLLSAFQDASDKNRASSIEDVFGKMKINDDMRKDMGSMGVNMSDPTTALQQVAEKIKNAGGEDFTGKIKAAIASDKAAGGTANLRSLMEEMQDSIKKQTVKDAESTNPIDEAALQLKIANGELRDKLNPNLLALIRAIGPTGFIALGMASLGASMATLALNIATAFPGFAKAMATTLGKVWKGASKVAVASGGAMATGGRAIANGGRAAVAGATGLLGKTKALGKTALVGAGKLGAKAGLTAGTGGAALVLFAAIDAAMGAWEGYENTAKNFGKTIEEVTLGMTVASTTGGALAGALDGLTFGLLGLFGIKEPLEKVLSWITYTFIAGFEALWQGIVNGFSKTMEFLDPVWQYLYSAWGRFEEAVVGLLNEFGLAGTNFSEIMDGVRGIFEGIWSAVKPVFGFFGNILGGTLATALTVLAGALGVVIDILAFLINILKYFVKTIKLIATPFIYVGEVVANIVKGIFGWFKWLWDVLVGHSIIPDLVYGIIDFFLMLPINIMKSLASLTLGIFNWISDTVVSGISGASTWIYDNFIGIFGKIFDWISSKVGNILGPIVKNVSEIREGVTGEKSVASIENSNNSMSRMQNQAAADSQKQIIETVGLEEKLNEAKRIADLKSKQVITNEKAMNADSENISKSSSWILPDFADAGYKTAKSMHDGSKQRYEQSIPIRDQALDTASRYEEALKVSKEYAGQKYSVQHEEAIAKFQEELQSAMSKGDAVGVDINSALLKQLGEQKEKETKVISSNDKKEKEVQPMGITKVHDRVRQEMFGEKASGSEKNISEINTHSEEQVNLLKEVSDGIQQLVAMLKPKAGVAGGGGVSTRANKKPTHSPDYGQWAALNNQQAGASRQVITDGVT